MIKFERNTQYNTLRRKLLGGKITSIWKDDTFFKGASSFPLPNLKYYTAEFCDFEKNIVSAESKMIYHLNGYGTRHNEAMGSFLGESSERYTFASCYKLLAGRIVKGSIRDMRERFGEDAVPPADLLNSYHNKEERGNYLFDEDPIRWVRMNSLIRPGEDVYIPLQMAVSDSGILFKGEKRFVPAAVSTGTAGQETFLRSLENAVIEMLQIDSFNLWWYGGGKGKDVTPGDMKAFLSGYFDNPDELRVFLQYFEPRFTDISFDKDIDVIVCEIFGRCREVPRYTVGVQGGTGLEKCLYRGFMECMAVLEYNMHLPWIDPDRYHSVDRTESRNCWRTPIAIRCRLPWNMESGPSRFLRFQPVYTAILWRKPRILR